MEGSFYTQRIAAESYAYASSFYSDRDTADLHIQISVENDTLRVFNYEFPVHSITQTSFSQSFGTFYNPEELKLDYYNNHDSIVLSHEILSRVAGANPASKVIYSGVKNASNDISGSNLYTLKVIHKEFAAQVDTQYTADVMVDVILSLPYSGYYSIKYAIGTNELRYNSFYTYSNEYKTGDKGTSRKVVYMENDSLYIDYYVTTTASSYPSYTIDTAYYSYQGIKKQ
jgi:hypothetical protein